MADIRIKDLATLESASLTGDVFVIDGTTGTRKLSAFSPTFGGNATVTGTLTVNGTFTAANGTSTAPSICFSSATTSGFSRVNTNSIGIVNNGIASGYIDGVTAGGGLYIAASGTNQSIYLVPSGTGAIVSPNQLSVTSTTASTTTSTGALVVGNGTSGGLGVGGSVNIGGRLTVGTTALSDRMFYVSGSTGTTGASQFSAVVNPTIPNTVTTGAYGLYLGTNIAAGATVTNSYSLYVASPDYTGSTITNKYGLYSADTNPSYFAGKVSIADSTASTSTSSGALVVSGGVGVAEQIHAKYYTATSNIVAGFTANTHVLDYYSGTARNVVFGPDASTIGNWKLQLLRSDASASIDALTISNAGNGVFYGSVKTAAPSGGTAAAWKLGTVATVSPTSPNRTIEVDIGGTIYYIAAKTTNN